MTRLLIPAFTEEGLLYLPDRLLSPLEWRFSRLGSDVLRVRPPGGFVDASRLDAIRGSECQSQAGLRGVPGSGSRCVSRRGSAPPSDTPRGLFPNFLMSTQTKTGEWSPDEQETSPLKLLKPKLDYDSGTQNPPCWQLTRRHHSAGALLARHTRLRLRLSFAAAIRGSRESPRRRRAGPPPRARGRQESRGGRW